MEENFREEKRVVYLSYYGNPGVGKKKQTTAGHP
jgi:hypothetical protein